MSDALIVRRGGTGGLSLLNAVIHVNVEAGSTVTFIKEGVTVKVLGPTKGHINADGKTADYYYSVSSVNFGAWTVSAVKGSSSNTASVTVSENKQYDVKILYALILFDNGTVSTALGTFSKTGSSGATEISGGAIVIASNQYSSDTFVFSNSLNIKALGYTQLKITITTSNNNLRVGISGSTSVTNSSFSASYYNSAYNPNKTVSISVGNITSGYFAGRATSDGSNAVTKITKVWLE